MDVGGSKNDAELGKDGSGRRGLKMKCEVQGLSLDFRENAARSVGGSRPVALPWSKCKDGLVRRR